MPLLAVAVAVGLSVDPDTVPDAVGVAELAVAVTVGLTVDADTVPDAVGVPLLPVLDAVAVLEAVADPVRVLVRVPVLPAGRVEKVHSER